MISANMDQGATDFQIEAAISKIFGSVRDVGQADEGDWFWEPPEGGLGVSGGGSYRSAHGRRQLGL